MLYKTVCWDDVKEGEELPTLVKEVTATTIIAGTLAFRDFHPLHHDRDFAVKQGVPDIFMSFLNTSGWASSYLTRWSGPEGELKRMGLSFAAPCFPGATLKWSGRVVKKYINGHPHLVDVEFTATVPLGNHCIGTATMVLPAKGSDRRL